MKNLIFAFACLFSFSVFGQTAQDYLDKGFWATSLIDKIDLYTRAIKIDPDYAAAFNNRGSAKFYLKLDYCSDYKKACDLGVCNNYNTFCK
jgi:hypothetical protein